jgi:signal transduction histidine kinase
METILIVEDQEANREFLAALLQYRGCRVLTAGNGEDALAVAREARPDLVIADVLMPRMVGYEFVRQLRKDPVIGSMKVIFYTASYVEEESRVLAQACGVSRVVTKPCEPEEILRVIDEMLGTNAPSPAPVVEGAFKDRHLRLVTDKLSEKVNELERLNAELEERVAARTVELAEANAQLVELNRMKDHFLAIVSHDLRTPLSGILLAAETVSGHGATMDEKKRNRLLEQIANCAREQIAFVEDLLALARSERSGGKPAFNPVRISDVARHSATSLGFSARAKGIELTVAGDPKEPKVDGDRLRLLQLFNNLIANAIKFTPEGGRISIEVEPGEGAVIARIRDTGVGIPSEHLPAFRDGLDAPQREGTAGEKGTGFGLSIVKDVMALHGGSVSVQSEPGQGTIFTLRFPTVAAEADTSDQGDSRPARSVNV